MFNDDSSDITAENFNSQTRHGTQVKQNANVDTYVKTTGAGWTLLVDTNA